MNRTKRQKITLEGKLICKEKLLIVIQEAKDYWASKDEIKTKNLSQHEQRVKSEIDALKEKINNLTKHIK